MFPVDGYSPDFELDRDGETFINFVRNYGHTQSIVVGYESAMARCIQLLNDREYIFGSVVTTDGKLVDKLWKLYFRNPQFKSPEFTPIYCMENSTTYAMELLCDVVIKTDDKKRHSINVSMGYFPVMIGSRYDIIATVEAKKKHGQDRDEPKGTFIVEGEPKTFNMYEMLRVNEILVYSETTDPKDITKMVCTITTESKYGKTSVISMKINKDNIIQFASFRGFAVSGKEATNLNVLQMFRLFGYTHNIGNKSVMDFILQFTRPEWKHKVQTLLTPTLHEYINSSDAQLLSDITTIKHRADKKKIFTLEDYRKEVSSNLYSHIDEDQIKGKLALLSIQIVRTIEARLGLIPLQRRDEYSVKRFKNVGGAMYHLFGIFLEDKILGKENDNIGIANTHNPYIHPIDNIKVEFAKKDITVSFEASFKKNWGLKGARGVKKSVFVEPLKNDEFVLQHFHVDKIVRGRDIHSHSYEIRGMQGTQPGFTDWETPETGKCGLNGTVGLTEWTSIYSNDQPIIEYMLALTDEGKESKDSARRLVRKKFERALPKGFYDTLFLVNGVPIGACNGALSREALLAYRRGNIPFYDIAIYYNDQDHYLYVNTDAGRPTRPLLIVNQQSGKLFLDEMGLQNQYNTVELLRYGVIEFIDAKEQEYALVCRDRHYLDKIDQDIKNLEEKIAKLRFIRSELPKGAQYVRSFIDPEQFVTPEEKDTEIDNKKEELMVKFNKQIDKYEDLTNRMEELINDNKKKVGNNFADKVAAINGEMNQVKKEINLYDPEKLISAKKKNDNVSKSIVDGQLARYVRQLEKMKRFNQYEYCEINQNAILGITSSLLPYLNKNPGPRQVFGCKMAKQAQSYTTHSLKWRQMTTKYLTFPVRARAETQTSKLIGLHRHPIGVMVSIVIATDEGWGIEDALIIREAFVQSGGYQSVSSKNIKDVFEKSSQRALNDESVVTFHVTNELPEDITKKKPLAYRNLDSRGVIIPGSIVNLGDCVLGRYHKRVRLDGSIKYIDNSIYIKRSKVGLVDSVIYNDDRSDKVVFIASISQTRNPQVGDKFTSGHAQKGTSSRFINDDETPICISGPMAGMRPDVIMNPHAYPSRMTIGMLEEIFASVGAVLEDSRIDASAGVRSNLSDIGSYLESKGLHSDGKQVFMNPTTGKVFSNRLYTGYVYYYRLTHESRDKIQNRYEGNYKQKTHQPVTGIDNDGGQRYGEMEMEAFLTHGCVYLLEEALTRASDLYLLYTCLRCNTQIYRGDGDIFNCPTCKNIADVGFATTVHVQKNLEHYAAGFGVKNTYVMQPIDSRIISEARS